MRGRRMIGVLAAMAASAVMLVACTAAPSDQGVRVLVIGDQMSAGDGWAAEWDRARSDVVVDLDAVDTSGYLTASPGAVSDRVSEADVIVLALGANDLDAQLPDEIVDGASRQAVSAATASAERVLVLSPLASPSQSVSAWSERLSAIAAAAGATFVSVDLDAGMTGPEGLTSAGRAQVAAKVSDALG